MSDMFESLDLNMREEAERINPTKAIMASQLECEQRFESFVSRNPERVDFLSDDIRSIADKYSAEYDIPSETIYEATVTHLKEAAVKQAGRVDPFAGKDEAHSDLINDYVGYNMDLEQVELYWDQYKPLVESALRGPIDEEHSQQLQAELEHIKNELQGIGGEEEGSEKYWALEEEISDALNALYRQSERQTFSSVEKDSEWDKPWTEEDESKEEEEEESEEKEEEDEEEEKKESSIREAKECNCWDGYKRVPGTKPCAPGSCEKCDADREKKKAAFILENADALVPEWIQKNAGWREMLRGFMNRNSDPVNKYFDPDTAPDWSSEDKPLPPRRRNRKNEGDQMDQLEAQEQPEGGVFPTEEVLQGAHEDKSRAELEMADRARRREKMIEGEPEFKKRGPHRYEYLRGASVRALEEFYVAQGMPEKTASILVEAVGEMAQLQQNEPGLPVAANDPDNVNIDKEIGGKEGDKYRNINVEETSKAIGVEHQDPGPEYEDVREFVQPGGEAPYADNDERTEKNKDKYKGEADRSKMDGKGVKQEDNAPKQSSRKTSKNWDDMTMEELLAMKEQLEGYLNRPLTIGESWGPDTGEDDMASQEMEDLRKYIEERNQKNAASKKSSASIKEAMNQTFPLNPEYEGRAREIVDSEIQKDLNRNQNEDFRGYLPGHETQEGMYTEQDKNELEHEAVYQIMKEFGVSSDTDGLFDYDQLLDWVTDIVDNSEIGKNISITKRVNDNIFSQRETSNKEASELSLVPPEGVRSAARRGIKYHSEGKAGDGFESATLARAKKIAEGQELTPEHVKRMHSFFERHAGGRSTKAKQGEVTPWDVAWLAWGGDAGRTWAASKVKQMENSKEGAAPLDFDTIDNKVEKLMDQGMTPEQAIQSLGVYNEDNFLGWGGSSRSTTTD